MFVHLDSKVWKHEELTERENEKYQKVNCGLNSTWKNSSWKNVKLISLVNDSVSTKIAPIL